MYIVGYNVTCEQTIRPHSKQLLTSVCFCPRQLQGWRPGTCTAMRDCPSVLMRGTNLVLVEADVLLVDFRSDCDTNSFGAGAGCGVGLDGFAVVVCGR